MKFSEFENKKVLIVGRGREGRATEKVLRTRVPTCHITMTDREDGENYLDIQNDYDIVVRSPGVTPSFITRPYTTPTNIFFANIKGTVIGVTGTKGKSTTATLIHKMLSDAGVTVNLIGNIGKPAIEELLMPADPLMNYVFELSSYQLEDIQYSPQISVIINLYPDHMDHHGSLEDYYKSKRHILDHVREEDTYIYNPAFPLLQQWSTEVHCKTIPYIESLPFDTSASKLIGEHNRDNMRAAITVARLFHIEDDILHRSILTFEPLHHRIEPIGTFNGISFYDDAISTTPESTIKAIEALGNVKTIFLGGLDRGYDFTTLIQTLKTHDVKSIVLFPDSGIKIKEALKQVSDYQPVLFETTHMNMAVQFAYHNTPAGSSCLLSTASPSYSLWKNFEEKGDLFKQYVNQFATR